MTSWTMASLDGRRGYKLVPGRFPPIRHFQRIADARNLDMLDAVETMTDDAVRNQIGQIGVVPADERFGVSHAAPIMAALSCFNPGGSMLSDGSYGVFYLQTEAAAAISDARREMSVFLAATKEKPTRLRLSMYSLGLAGDVADLRKVEGINRAQLASDPCIESRRLGKRLRAAGVAGALYPNARAHGADSLALFNASALTDCVPCGFIELNWGGESIDRVTELSGTEVLGTISR